MKDNQKSIVAKATQVLQRISVGGGLPLVAFLVLPLFFMNCQQAFHGKRLSKEAMTALKTQVFVEASPSLGADDMDDVVTTEQSTTDIQMSAVPTETLPTPAPTPYPPGSTPPTGGTPYPPGTTPSPDPTPCPEGMPLCVPGVVLPGGTPPVLPSATPTTDPTPVPPYQCSRHNATLDALRDSIKMNAATADQSVTQGELNGCEAGLIKFAAAAVDDTGKVIKSMQISGYNKARVGIYCPFKAVGIDLLIRGFAGRGIRGKSIKATYLCKFGTDPAACKPSSADFIAGFDYGSFGSKYRMSNVDGVGDANVNVAPGDIVEKILLPGDKALELSSCNKVAVWSPLVVESQLGKGIRTLDPMKTQTYFDLTGTGVKNRISCVRNGAFVVLPDANGKIVNINQLFGNNTVGPDGKKAVNGFVALGKHDLKPKTHSGYGTITAVDPVFSRLRLWDDENCNGQADAGELMVLNDWGIIGLRWLDYVEMMQVDKYGNQTRQRNIALQYGKKFLRVFDLWFLAAYGSK
jgi:hypothetical protein